MKVQTIQVGRKATAVLPCAFTKDGTIFSVAVIITIFGGKWKPSMTTKGISSGTFKNNGNN